MQNNSQYRYKAYLSSVASYLPDNVVTNDNLSDKLDTSDEWIRTRTGITKRYILDDEQNTSDLAYEAAYRSLKKRLAVAGDDAKLDQIDAIIVATSTPDYTMPSVAAMVHKKLIAHDELRVVLPSPALMDLQAACSGFVYGVAVASSMVAAGNMKRILLIAADAMSRILDWEDRTSAVLFGDGAGAVIIENLDDERLNSINIGDAVNNNFFAEILATDLCGDGTLAELIATTGGVSSSGDAGKFIMQGKEVFRHATSKMAENIAAIMAKIGKQPDDIDLLIPHQANQRILDTVAKKLGLPEERLVSTIDLHANCSAASIPLALSVAEEQSRVESGNIMVFEGLGSGLTWGSVAVKVV